MEEYIKNEEDQILKVIPITDTEFELEKLNNLLDEAQGKLVQYQTRITEQATEIARIEASIVTLNALIAGE